MRAEVFSVHYLTIWWSTFNGLQISERCNCFVGSLYNIGACNCWALLGMHCYTAGNDFKRFKHRALKNVLLCVQQLTVSICCLHMHEVCMYTYRISVVVPSCFCFNVQLNSVSVNACMPHACQQEDLRQWLPIRGWAEGRARGREEEVQSQWAGQQNHLPHSDPQDVSPTKYPPLAFCSTTFCQQS